MFETFDSSNKVHVQWLKKLLESDLDKKMEILKSNPMKEEFPSYDMIHVVFGLSAKYVKAVFNKTAVILE